MVENCFTVQVHVAKRRMGQHQGPQCMSLHFGQKDSGLGDSVIRFPCVWNQGHERGRNGAGLEELASALESDVGDSAASQSQQKLFTNDHILTLFPPPVCACMRVCVCVCVCVCVWSVFLSSLWNQAIIPSCSSHLSLSAVFPFLRNLPQLQLYILLHRYLNVLHWSGHSLRWLLQWWEVFLQWLV